MYKENDAISTDRASQCHCAEMLLQRCRIVSAMPLESLTSLCTADLTLARHSLVSLHGHNVLRSTRLLDLAHLAHLLTDVTEVTGPWRHAIPSSPAPLEAGQPSRAQALCRHRLHCCSYWPHVAAAAAAAATAPGQDLHRAGGLEE